MHDTVANNKDNGADKLLNRLTSISTFVHKEPWSLWLTPPCVAYILNKLLMARDEYNM